MNIPIEKCDKIQDIPNLDYYYEPLKIKVSTNDKGLLFVLGYAFAMGMKIQVINKQEIQKEANNYKCSLEKPNKSFLLMAYVWEKLFETNFEEKCEFDRVIGNFKRMGVVPERYDLKEYEKQENKIFLISPVRNATKEQQEEIENYKKMCVMCGKKIYVPHLDTVQTDLLGGYTICCQNAEGLSTSEAIFIYYDKNSKGSMFDLGVVYACNQPLIVINEDTITYDENDFGDQLLNNWPDLVNVNEKKYNYYKSITSKVRRLSETKR